MSDCGVPTVYEFYAADAPSRRLAIVMVVGAYAEFQSYAGRIRLLAVAFPIWWIANDFFHEGDKQAHLCRQEFAIWIDRVKIAAGYGKFWQHFNQSTFFNFLGHFPRAAPCQAVPRQRPTRKHFTIIAMHVASHFDGDIFDTIAK